MQRDVAETTCKMVDEIIKKMSHFLKFANANGDDDEARKRAKLAIGTCIAKLDLEILEPVYRAYPDLKPEFLKAN